MSAAAGSVTIDLQAAQSPHYRERGIARYALDFTQAVAAKRPDVVAQVLLSARFERPAGVGALSAQVEVTHRPEWSSAGAAFHALSPFELDIPVTELWPREVSRLGMRLVVTLYDLIPELFPQTYLRNAGVRRRYRARRELVRAADHLMTLSRSAADDAVRVLGVPASKITVVGAAPNPCFSPVADRDSSARLAAEAVAGLEERYVVYNGAVEPRKNMERLLEAFASVSLEVRGDWQLVLICKLSEPERNHYQMRARELGIAERLLLTGYLGDADLVRVYQGASLVVYPSLYEGYGLPVAEALACGAPVIASANSSLPELVAPGATFDAGSTESIRSALEKGFTNREFRSELLDWAARPRRTWEDVAESAVATYDEVVTRPRSPASWRPRPRVALVTPWPPATTGVADYNRRLVAAIGSAADVDVFVDGDRPLADDADRRGLLPLHLPVHDRAAGGYEAVVISVGNSEFHSGALSLIRKGMPGSAVHAHDARLVGLYLHGEARGAVGEGFRSAMAEMYPPFAAEILAAEDPREIASAKGLLMMKEIAALSDAVMMTSESALALARSDCAEQDRVKLGVWPYAYPEARDRDGSAIEPDLVCSFGLVNPLKEPESIVSAVALLASEGRDVRLAFVGPVAKELREHLETIVDSHGLASRVVFSGKVAETDYVRWIERATIAVQLRSVSNGETSGAVADCLASGIPVIVSDIGPQAELPSFVPKVPRGAPPDQLADQMRTLLDDPALRATFAAESRAFVSARGFDGAARDVLKLALAELNPDSHP